jgi:hypothetical protein
MNDDSTIVELFRVEQVVSSVYTYDKLTLSVLFSKVVKEESKSEFERGETLLCFDTEHLA